MADNSMSNISKVLFRAGQVLLASGFVFFIVSLVSNYWVVRPTVDFQKENINANKTLVTMNYGIFLACRQNADKSEGECDSLWQNLNFINAGAARYVQFVMCLAVILYAGSASLEVVQCLPTDRFRNFIAKNRMVEMFSSIACLLVLQGMLIFAGEIKNKAERVSGQEDEQPGWSFVLAIVGLFLSIVGVLMIVMFRDLPVPGSNKIGGSWLRPSSPGKRNSADL